MGWNPLNWQITDTLQGQEGGYDLNPFNQSIGGLTGGGAGVVYTDTGDTDSSQVLGATTGATYYDSSKGYVVDQNGNRVYATDQPAEEGQVLGQNTGGTTPSYNQDDVNFLNDQESLYRRLLESVGTQLNNGISKLDQSKIAAENEATKQQERELGRLNTQRYDTQVDKQKALGTVDNNARTLYDSLKRILGIASGSGSSAYKYAAPNAVARDASIKRSGVMSSFGRNERNIDTATNETNVDFQDLLSNIAQQRRAKEEELRAGIYGQEQGLQSELSNIAGERAKLLGGGYGSVRVAQEPYRNRFLELQSQLDTLPNQFANAVTPRQLKTINPSLEQYTVDKTALNANQGSQSQYSPYSQFLNRFREDDEQKIYG